MSANVKKEAQQQEDDVDEPEPVFDEPEEEISENLPEMHVNGLRITDRRLCALLYEAEQKQRTADVYVGESASTLPESATICVNNNVIQLKLNMYLHWSFIVPRCFRYGMRYATRKFGAIDFPCVGAKATLRIYSHSITCNGARKISDAVYWVQRVLIILSELEDHLGMRPYAGLACTIVKLVNIVASVNVGVSVDLARLGTLANVKYQPLEWPNAKICMRDIDPVRYGQTRVVALVSADGNLVISGARSREELVLVYSDVLPFILAHAAESRLKTIDSQRREAKNVVNVQNLPANSLAIITVNHKRLAEANTIVPRVESSALVACKPVISSLAKLGASQTVAKNMMVLQSFELKREADAAELAEVLGAQHLPRRVKLLDNKTTAALMSMNGYYDDE